MKGRENGADGRRRGPIGVPVSTRVPERPRCRVLVQKRRNVLTRSTAKRFRKHSESYFRFVTTPGVEPTNNLAEQAIRHVVIDRRITQGTRGTNGQRWSERIWTTLATCAQQGRSAFEFLGQAMHAHLTGLPPPSLLPA